MALPLHFVQSMMVSRMATIFTAYFVRIHSIICMIYIQWIAQSTNSITSVPISKLRKLLITSIIFLYQLSLAQLECLVGVSLSIRIFSLSIQHRTSCIYGLEEVLTCKGGGSLLVWLIAVRELSSYRARQFLWQLAEVSFLLSSFFIGVDCHIRTKGPVGS